jgi:hypothetical protein
MNDSLRIVLAWASNARRIPLLEGLIVGKPPKVVKEEAAFAENF